jgi:hypothetical protein
MVATSLANEMVCERRSIDGSERYVRCCICVCMMSMIKNSAAMNMNISNFFCATMSFVIYNSIQQSNEDWKKKMAAERKQKSRLLQDQALVLKQSRESKQQSRAKLTPQEKQTINKKRRDARAILHSTESQHRRQERRTQEKLRVRLFRNKQASSIRAPRKMQHNAEISNFSSKRQ